jgi:hypothetical protein
MEQWQQSVLQFEAEKQRRQTAFLSANEKIESRWASSKLVLAESKVAEGGSFPFEQMVSVARGELLLLTVLPNENHGADSTLVEWTICETNGEQRVWSVADLVPSLVNGNSWSDKNEHPWSFLETTSTPVFLTERHDSIAGRPELKSWSLGSEPSVFVNSAAEPVQVWTTFTTRISCPSSCSVALAANSEAAECSITLIPPTAACAAYSSISWTGAVWNSTNSGTRTSG